MEARVGGREASKRGRTGGQRHGCRSRYGCGLESGGSCARSAGLTLTPPRIPLAQIVPFLSSPLLPLSLPPLSLPSCRQASALKAWGGEDAKLAEASKAFLERATANGQAAQGKYMGGAGGEEAGKSLFQKDYAY